MDEHLDEHLIVIKPGEELPHPGETYVVNAMFSGGKDELKIESIIELRWHSKNGNLIVTVEAVRKPIDEP